MLPLWICFMGGVVGHDWFAAALQSYCWGEPREGTGKEKTRGRTRSWEPAARGASGALRPVSTMSKWRSNSHTFLLHTKAMGRKRKGDGERLYKATGLFPEKAPRMHWISRRCGLADWREMQWFYQVSSVAKHNKRIKYICLETITVTIHLRRSVFHAVLQYFYVYVKICSPEPWLSFVEHDKPCRMSGFIFWSYLWFCLSKLTGVNISLCNKLRL